MGNLHQARAAHHQRPFTNSGVDYFGPMQVAVGRRREKRWRVLFTCLTTRAVHIELASSLNTDLAIMALRRLVARGHPTNIYSDNGTNLKGASTELLRAIVDLEDDRLQNHAINLGATWHFLPPAAPHMGGCWERLVRSIKVALAATLKERTPREEVLHTLLLEVEHTVNSRPLTHVSVDSRDPEALTPNHFLISSSSGSPLPGKFCDTDIAGRKQWRIAQKLADAFWSKWLCEYLPELSPRRRWTTNFPAVKVGDVVIVVDTSLTRNSWPKGRINKLFPGKDGVTRVVEVKTMHGTMRRPVTEIVLIRTSEEGTE